ncbi:SDR family NAD(P)-dependent oxidoreductase [Asanoa siamensis]|uniref:Short-chain dehydrogenase n=1 Tax=Asanoa siamensis TaxID=926357 RepID=A0ABQ4CT30_9ACTN|nr:SDR family oxidoreductase [Asanoa siamensis]GIF74434.1 short-chain dehydrogenase [Asanoa siamensis]
MTTEPDRGAHSLAGRRVLLTGACGGIAYALANGLARAGARLALSDVDGDALDALAESLPGGGHTTLPVRLSGADGAQALAEGCAARLGGLDVLVHTAAVLRRQEVPDVTEADWDHQHDVNLKATFFLARAVAEQQREQGGGSIVLYTSQSFWTGGYGASVVYATTKGGVATMVRGLARTYGPYGVRVNGIAPGIVDTPMLSGAAIDAIVAATPLGRVGQPEDLVGPTLFLASPESAFVTGTILNVSGGWLAY